MAESVSSQVVYPPDDTNYVIRVVQGSQKNRPGVPLHHVVFTINEVNPSFSICSNSCYVSIFICCNVAINICVISHI